LYTPFHEGTARGVSWFEYGFCQTWRWKKRREKAKNSEFEEKGRIEYYCGFKTSSILLGCCQTLSLSPTGTSPLS
jgi:hypothetical protein